MANTIRSVGAFSPGNLDQHKSYTQWGDSKPVGSSFSFKSAGFTPGYGKTCEWKNFKDAPGSNAAHTDFLVSQGNIYDSSYSNGAQWQIDTGASNGCISAYEGNGMWLPSSILSGVSFELYRNRVDSDNAANDNAKQHCIFLRHYGVQLINRTSGTTRFWSSDVCQGPTKSNCGDYYKTSGSMDEKQPDGRYANSSAKAGDYKFYKATFPSSFTGNDWLVKGIWFFVTTRWDNAAGSSKSNVYIYNLKWHVSNLNGSRLLLPTVRSEASRNTITF